MCSSDLADHYTLRASYVNYCPADRGYVTVWWQDALTEDWASPLQLSMGQSQDGVDLHLPDDDDHDGMADCDDGDCDGFCHEGPADPSRCADGRDNDRDGVTDGELHAFTGVQGEGGGDVGDGAVQRCRCNAD